MGSEPAADCPYTDLAIAKYPVTDLLVELNDQPRVSRLPNRTHITAVMPTQTMMPVMSDAVRSPSINISTTNATRAGMSPDVIAAAALVDVVTIAPPHQYASMFVRRDRFRMRPASGDRARSPSGQRQTPCPYSR